MEVTGSPGCRCAAAARQGARDYLDRLDALLADHHRHTATPPGPATGDGATDPLRVWAGVGRAHRGADVHAARAARAATGARDRHQEWITASQGRIAAVVSALLHNLRRVGVRPDPDGDPGGDLTDHLDWLTEDHVERSYSPATFATLGLALGQLRRHPDLVALAPNHGLRLALRGVDQLRSDFADLRPPDGRARPPRADEPSGTPA